MRVAVASNDNVMVSSHFGRSAAFLVFEVDESGIVAREVRNNSYTPHALGQCREQHEAGYRPNHGHEGIIGALGDCQAVVTGGMGRRAAEDLRGHGIVPFLAPPNCAAEEAAVLCARRLLPEIGTEGCGAH
jgi:predicted Fe-Mo cluster-binding NifX family protein